MFNACKGICSIFSIFKNPQQRQQQIAQLSRESIQDRNSFQDNLDEYSEQQLFDLQQIDQQGVLEKLQQFLNRNKESVNNNQIFKDTSQSTHNPYYDYLHLILEIKNFQPHGCPTEEYSKLQYYQQRLKQGVIFIKKLAQFLYRKFFKSTRLNKKCKEFKIMQLQNAIQNAIISAMYISLHLNQIQNSLLQYQFLTNFKEILSLMEYYLQAQEHTFIGTTEVVPKYNQKIHNALTQIKEICQNTLLHKNDEMIFLDWDQFQKKIILQFKKYDDKSFDMSFINQEILDIEKQQQQKQSSEQQGVYFEMTMPLKRTSSYVKEIKHYELTRSSSIESKSSNENQFTDFYKENEARLLKLNLQQMGDLAF